MRMFGFLIACFTVAGVALFPTPALSETLLPDAGDIREVVAVGPSWNSFTNMDGTGLYHVTLNKVFGLYGITCRLDLIDNHGRVRVEDTGPGVASLDRDDIFNKFKQLGDTHGPSPGCGPGNLQGDRGTTRRTYRRGIVSGFRQHLHLHAPRMSFC